MGLIDFTLHIGDRLVTIVNIFGNWTYLILFAIILIETGLVIFPFLPGDSLIPACCVMAAIPKYNLHFWVCYLILIVVAVLSGTINYEIGHWSQAEGTKHSWFNELINQNKRKAVENFFDRHSGITIVIGRFIPFIRTPIPSVSGAGRMHYRIFIIYNLIGGSLWVTLFSALGFLFGNIPVVQEHFSLIAIAIVLISVLPILIIWPKKKLVLKKELR